MLQTMRSRVGASRGKQRTEDVPEMPQSVLGYRKTNQKRGLTFPASAQAVRAGTGSAWVTAGTLAVRAFLRKRRRAIFR